MGRTTKFLATGWHIQQSAAVTQTETGKSPGMLPTTRMVELRLLSILPVSMSGVWIQWKR